MSLKDERIAIAEDAVRYALRELKILDMQVVGSAYISDTLGSDVDFIVFGNIKSDGTNCDVLERDGWKYGGSDKGGDGWAAFKKTVDGVLVNLIVVDDHTYWYDWLIAARTCRAAYLAGINLPREVVHAIHSVIMDNGDPLIEVQTRRVQDAFNFNKEVH